jgi:HSP20 family protein
MLMRFDPFREAERVTDQAIATLRGRSGPMAIDAFRRGGDVHIQIDLPGVDPGSIDLVVEKNVLSVSAERRSAYGSDDEVVVAERAAGHFTRQLFLGEGLDADRVAARYEDGVLTVIIPVAEQARPRRVAIATPHRATAVASGGSTSAASSPPGSEPASAKAEEPAVGALT